MKTRFDIYLIGWDPPGFCRDRDFWTRMMHECDTTAIVSGPLGLGDEFRTTLLVTGPNGTAPLEDQLLRVVGHKHGGKVVIAEVVVPS